MGFCRNLSLHVMWLGFLMCRGRMCALGLLLCSALEFWKIDGVRSRMIRLESQERALLVYLWSILPFWHLRIPGFRVKVGFLNVRIHRMLLGGSIAENGAIFDQKGEELGPFSVLCKIYLVLCFCLVLHCLKTAHLVIRFLTLSVIILFPHPL